MDALEHPDRQRVQTLYELAVELRRNADPLLEGQYEALVGRLTALLAVLGAPVPDDALPPFTEGDPR